MANESLLGFEAQPARGSAGGDDYGARLGPIAFDAEAKGAAREIGVEDGPVHVFGAEILRLFPHVLDEIRPADAFRETGKVFHQGGEGKLPAGCMPIDDEWAEIRSGRIDCGGQSRASGTDDDYISHV